MQAVWNLIGRLIWFCTVCLRPTKKTLGLYGLNSTKLFISDQGQSSCAYHMDFKLMGFFVVFFCLIWFFTSQSTIFQLCCDGSSWADPVLSKDKSVLLKDTTQSQALYHWATVLPQVDVDFWQRHWFFQYLDTVKQVLWQTVKLQMKSAIGSAEEHGGSGIECLTPGEGLQVRALSSADFFTKFTLQKILSGCQIVWIQIRTDRMSVLILQRLSADNKSRH